MLFSNHHKKEAVILKKIAFFDLDGTISDSGTGIINAITYAEQKLKLKPISSEDKKSCVGPPLNKSFMRLYGLTLEEAENMIDVYREYYWDKGIYENYLYPDIPRLISTLKDNGWELRICSGKPTVMVETVLKHFNLYHYFTSLQGAKLHGIYPGKSKFIKEILDKENAIAIMVGDRSDDIEGAKANNIVSFGVLWGYGTKEELETAGATYIVKNVDEILKELSTI
ncbi:MAG: HAD family hydrolase [Clostridiales bacterium]|nr:HAD family hydrolase [Clostridiales bacterium]